MIEKELEIHQRQEGEMIKEGVTVTDTLISKYVRIREGNVIINLRFDLETGTLLRAIKLENI